MCYQPSAPPFSRGFGRNCFVVLSSVRLYVLVQVSAAEHRPSALKLVIVARLVHVAHFFKVGAAQADDVSVGTAIKLTTHAFRQFDELVGVNRDTVGHFLLEVNLADDEFALEDSHCAFHIFHFNHVAAASKRRHKSVDQQVLLEAHLRLDIRWLASPRRASESFASASIVSVRLVTAHLVGDTSPLLCLWSMSGVSPAGTGTEYSGRIRSKSPKRLRFGSAIMYTSPC